MPPPPQCRRLEIDGPENDGLEKAGLEIDGLEDDGQSIQPI